MVIISLNTFVFIASSCQYSYSNRALYFSDFVRDYDVPEDPKDDDDDDEHDGGWLFEMQDLRGITKGRVFISHNSVHLTIVLSVVYNMV